jgi:hypothetical protein
MKIKSLLELLLVLSFAFLFFCCELVICISIRHLKAQIWCVQLSAKYCHNIYVRKLYHILDLIFKTCKANFQ